ncbi:MAG: CRISPR-associated helicase Cas3' [Thermodesulfobacteriota bacterium]
MVDIQKEFRSITGFEAPSKHQEQTTRHLLEGKSVVLRAPTGSGKSEAIVVPFLLGQGEVLPSQLIYSLPVRSLVDDLGARFQRYAKPRGIKVGTHHGKRVETPLFYPPIIVTTIDQTVGAYTCTPLSLPLRHGNIPAGAVSSSLLVFDEIHTFDPERALQSALILAEHSKSLMLPFVFMSATLPDSFVEELNKRFNIEFVDTNEAEIPFRKGRKVLIHWEESELTAESLIHEYASSHRKLIAVCNTVSKAQEIYRELKNRNEVDAEVLLLHSRFLPEDRQEQERRLKDIFGKKPIKEKGILIATQVIEVGMDISCDTMLTEVSPVDSLIQRAGRCARWGKQGHLHVFDVSRSAPYRQNIIDRTRDEIKALNKNELNWHTEKDLVNKVLGEYFRDYLKAENTAEVLNTLAQAAFEGDRNLSEDAVREVFSCEVSIHDNPRSLESASRLKRIKVHAGVVRKFFNDKQPTIWELVDNNIIDDEPSRLAPRKVGNAQEIMPYRFYIVHPANISYLPDEGLVFEPYGENFGCSDREEQSELEYSYKRESWVDHSRETLEKFREYFLTKQGFIIKKFADAWGREFSDFVAKMETAILLHDVGKLNKEWQEKIGWDRKEPLAHSGEENIRKPPSHAPLSAHILSPVFYEWGESLGEVFYLAVAHHHSLRSSNFPKYKLINGWRSFVGRLQIPDRCVSRMLSRGEGGKLSTIFPEMRYHEKSYRTYAFISRMLKLCDWLATGGEDAILRYENRNGDV